MDTQWKYFERLNLERFLAFHRGETLNPSLAPACAWNPHHLPSHIIIFRAARSTYPNLCLNTIKLIFVLDFKVPATAILALKMKPHVAWPEQKQLRS